MKILNSIVLSASLLLAWQSGLAQKDPDNTVQIDSTPVWVAKKYAYNPETTRKFELQHTQLAVSFDWQKQYLYGKATLTMQPYFYPQNQVVLDAKGFEIQQITLENGQALKYNYDKKKITINLPKTYNKGEKLVITINYIAKPNELVTTGSDAITSDKGLYFINPLGKEPNKPQQIWTQGETEANSCWFPTFDSPNVKTTQEIAMTVDKHFVTLSNGKLIDTKDNGDGTRTDTWRQDKPHAPYLFMMAVGKYAVVKDRWKDLELAYYVEPEYEKYAKAIFGNTPKMIDYFSTLLDYPFPWDKYSQVVVRDYVSGAMENTSASIFMEALQVDNRYLIDDNWDGIIAHELFHQWFGDLVTCESWANLPLNESFANYSELLWKEHLNGTDALEMQLYEEMNEYMVEAETKREPMIRYYYKDKEEMFDRHSYSKGAVLLHMLRKTVGDEAFFTALKLYLKKFAYKKAEIHDLRMVFEEVTGEDLNWFFDQWFLQAGHPKLTVKHSYNATTKKIQLTVKQEQDLRYTPLYRLPLYVDVWVKGKKNRYAVVIDEQKEVFEWEAAAQPDLVFFDGETQLLGEITHEKTMAEYVFQYKNSEKVLGRLEALQQLMKNEDFLQYEDVFLLALNDKVWELRMMAANVFDKYEGKNTEVLGTKLQALIENDKKSLVRATAISTLASIGATKYTDLFRKSLNDSSYAVVANALYAYYATGSPDAGEQFEKYENVDNLNITITVADYFASFKKRNKYDWFIRKMNRLQQSGGVSYLLAYFTQYLLNDEANLIKGADYLQNIAAKHSNYQVRIMAFQHLQMLPVKDMQQRKEQLRKEEKDQRVLEAYK